MPSVSGSIRSATASGPAPVRLCMAIGIITVLPISTKNCSARIAQHSTTVRLRSSAGGSSGSAARLS